MTLAGIWAAIKGVFGAGDVAAGVIEDAATDKRAADNLAKSAENVAEADKIAAEALPSGVTVVQPGRGPATATAGPDESTPPATPAARRPP